MSVQNKMFKSFKLTIPAGKATPAPPVGSTLGQNKVDIMKFCREFNDATKSYESGVPIPVIITTPVADNSFTFICKTPPTSYLVKKFAKVTKGSSEPGKGSYVGSITISDCKEIARMKLIDLSAYDIEQAVKIISGTARSMGLEIKS